MNDYAVFQEANIANWKILNLCDDNRHTAYTGSQEKHMNNY